MNDFFVNAKPIFVKEDNKEPVVSCVYRADFDVLENSKTYKINITGRSF